MQHMRQSFSETDILEYASVPIYHLRDYQKTKFQRDQHSVSHFPPRCYQYYLSEDLFLLSQILFADDFNIHI